MRALVVSNMAPSPEAPGRGSFVRDQVAALRRLDGLDVDLYEFSPRGYARAALELRRRYRRAELDVVHAHFGLTAWPALALRGPAHVVTLHGTDLRHPRSRRITGAALGRLDLVATVSASLAELVPGAGGRTVAVLPCGVDVDRFRPLPRADARRALGLDLDRPYVLFPSDPGRPDKRHDLAQEAVGEQATLLTLGQVVPADVPLWVNAANAVVVPSDHEGFGLAALEALACDVPVLATPVGVHPVALEGIAGALCAPFEQEAWRTALVPHLDAPDPRIDGRARAALFSAERMAQRVAAAWSELTGAPLYSAPEAPHEGAVSL